jgi:hypothetical protein
VVVVVVVVGFIHTPEMEDKVVEVVEVVPRVLRYQD